MREACRSATATPATSSARAFGEGWKDGRDKICIADTPGDFGLWAEQLIAESTGKQGKGLVPAPGESPDGDDRQAATPEIPDPFALGASSSAGSSPSPSRARILEINPFDQPDVQAAKDKTNEVLATRRGARARAGGLDRGAARAGEEGDYVCVQAFVDPTTDLDAARRAAPPRERLRRHARLRPALPPLDRPAPQGRPEHRPLPPGRRRPRARSCRFPASRSASAASSARRRRATSSRSRRAAGASPASTLEEL